MQEGAVTLMVRESAGMVVHRTPLWALIGICSVVGAVRFLVAERRSDRVAPSIPRAERCLTAALTGVGCGMAVATLILFAAALVARLDG